MERLKDKIVLITGAAGSVGKAVVEAVERPRARSPSPAICRPGRRRACARRHLGAGLAARHRRDRPHPRPARRPGQRRGLAALGNIEETDYATWRQILAVNLDGTFLGCKHGLALLKRRGGAIVNVSSVAGLIGGHNFAAYNASKGGVRLLTKSVALHGARLDPQGALQLGPSGLPRRPDGRSDSAADELSRSRARAHHPRHPARPARHARPRSPTCASICCRTNPASSPAPSSSSTAA